MAIDYVGLLKKRSFPRLVASACLPGPRWLRWPDQERDGNKYNETLFCPNSSQLLSTSDHTTTRQQVLPDWKELSKCCQLVIIQQKQLDHWPVTTPGPKNSWLLKCWNISRLGFRKQLWEKVGWVLILIFLSGYTHNNSLTRSPCFAHFDLCICQLCLIRNPKWEIWKKHSRAIS